MPSTPLKSAPSALNANVTLFTLPDTGQSVKRELSPSPPLKEYTTLRRTTRSTRSTQLTTKQESGENVQPGVLTANLSAYAYQPPTATPPRKRVKVEVGLGADDEDELKPVGLEDGDDGSTTPGTKKAKSKPLPQLVLDKPHPEPPRWREQHRLIERMRKGIVAPVDDM
jgi:endonuclease-3